MTRGKEANNRSTVFSPELFFLILAANRATIFTSEETTHWEPRGWIDLTQITVDSGAAGDGMDASHRLETFSPVVVLVTDDKLRPPSRMRHCVQSLPEK